jgi:hypothetical protein
MTGTDALIAIGVIVCLLILLAMWIAVASLRDGRHPQDDAQDLGADWGGEGSFQPHNDGCNAA